ncbi:MAG: hypothetical protein K6C99_09970 [Lachnospiraceae bacterium]|nr:hypothetical protein [Lachnospiraceae bacterium]
MMELLLLAAGLAAFIASFFIPERKGSTDPKELIDENALQEMIDEKIDDSRRRIDDMADETISYSMEKTERSLDKLTNEKLMAIGDYSNTVMGEINKSHEEVVFLSDMLGRNKDELTSLMQQADKISKEADKRANDAYDLANSAQKLAENAIEQADKANRSAMIAEDKMIDARRTIIEPKDSPVLANSETVADPVPDEMILSAVKESAAGDTAVKEAVDEGNDAQAVNDVSEDLSLSEVMADVKEDGMSEDLADAALRAAVKEEAPAKRTRKSSSKTTAAKSDSASAKSSASVKSDAAALAKPATRTRKKKETAALESDGQLEGQLSIPEVFMGLNSGNPSGKSGDRKENSNEKILEMHKMGRSNMAIARELGLGIGEVKLVIDLYDTMQ